MSQPAMKKCPECDGRGEWHEMLPLRSIVQESPEYSEVRCPECRGTGEVECDEGDAT